MSNSEYCDRNMFDIIRKCENSKPIELNLTSLLDETNLDGSGAFVDKDDTFLDPNTSVRFLNCFCARGEAFRFNITIWTNICFFNVKCEMLCQ